MLFLDAPPPKNTWKWKNILGRGYIPWPSLKTSRARWSSLAAPLDFLISNEPRQSISGMQKQGFPVSIELCWMNLKWHVHFLQAYQLLTFQTTPLQFHTYILLKQCWKRLAIAVCTSTSSFVCWKWSSLSPSYWIVAHNRHDSLGLYCGVIKW